MFCGARLRTLLVSAFVLILGLIRQPQQPSEDSTRHHLWVMAATMRTRTVLVRTEHE